MRAAVWLSTTWLAAGSAVFHPAQQGQEVASNEFLVLFHPHQTAALANARHVLQGDADVTVQRVVQSASDEFLMLCVRVHRAEDVYTKLLDMAGVRLVEPNYIAHITRSSAQECEDGLECAYGIDRVDGVLDGWYHWDEESAGQGASVYVLDTGINTKHPDFEGRARFGRNFVDPAGDYPDAADTDCHGHGTHVAGTVASRSFGVAKAAEVVGVRVLGCMGSGAYDGIIAGIDFAAQDGAAVINLSLGGGHSEALNAAVAAAHAAGTLVVSAAGNSFVDACNTSPANAEHSFTVCASSRREDGTDGWATYSNHGECTDIIAPGSDITSLAHLPWQFGATPVGVAAMSGTSMAAPHVAGVAAIFHSAGVQSPDEKRRALLEHATTWTGDVDDIRGTGTPQVVVSANVTRWR